MVAAGAGAGGGASTVGTATFDIALRTAQLQSQLNSAALMVDRFAQTTAGKVVGHFTTMLGVLVNTDSMIGATGLLSLIHI